MNININYCFKIFNPIFIIIFITFFCNTLLFLILPKRGINYVSKISILNNNSNNNLTKNTESISLKNKFSLSAIYKITGEKSWIIVNNKELEKTIFLKEGEKIKNYTLKEVNSKSARFSDGENEFILQLKIKQKNIQNIIRNGDSK